jgi:hypothetical protein
MRNACGDVTVNHGRIHTAQRKEIPICMKKPIILAGILATLFACLFIGRKARNSRCLSKSL